MPLPQLESNFTDLQAVRAFYDVAFVIGTEAANVINVALQVQDYDGFPVEESYHLDCYLASAADGLTLAAAPSGGVAIGTDGLLVTQLANQAFTLVSETDGDIDIDLTEAGAGTWYLVVRYPNGKIEVSGAITFV